MPLVRDDLTDWMALMWINKVDWRSLAEGVAARWDGDIDHLATHLRARVTILVSDILRENYQQAVNMRVEHELKQQIDYNRGPWRKVGGGEQSV